MLTKERETLRIILQDDDRFSDEENPALMFGLTSSNLLSKIVKGEIDPTTIAKYTLACRGQDENGNWVGFEKAKFWYFTTPCSNRDCKFYFSKESDNCMNYSNKELNNCHDYKG